MRLFTGLLVLGLTSTVATAADPTYPVHLSRPAHPGDTCRVAFKVTRTFSQTWTDPGTTRKPVRESFAGALDGDETVDAVGSNGRPTKLTYKVARCTRDGNQLLPAGSAVVAETVDGRTTVKVNGADPPADAGKVLKELLYTARPDEPTADNEFGTDQPHKVGDVWPADRDQMAKATHLPYRVTGDDFTGQAKLVDVSVVDGRSTETVLLTQRCEFDARPGSDGRTYKKLKMARDITLTLPLAGPPIGHATSTFKVAYTTVGPEGTADVAAGDVLDRTYSAIAP